MTNGANPLVEKIVNKVRDIPPLPHAVVKALELIRDARSNASDVVKVVSLDQGLTAKVLKLANSAYYGYSKRISTLSEAIVILGFKTLKSLLLASSVYNLMNKELDGYALEKGELWRHSVCAAFVARYTALKIRYRDEEEAFIAGLMHDIGKIVLSQYVKFGYTLIEKAVNERKIPFMDAEKEIFGVDHAEVGMKIAEKWNFPESLVEAIGYHHKPEMAERHPTLAGITHVADAICLMMGIGLGVDGLLYPLNGEVLEKIGLSDGIDNLIMEVSDMIASGDMELEV
ncbi:MAG: HDOD domain-containing protein [Synergistetes bacterium]|nr:HDOD domain-containing protein [Synergistota bacterium]